MNINISEKIEPIVDAIVNIVNDVNITITGRNMSGKSEILLQLIKKLQSLHGKDSVYFVDTVNRMILTEDDKTLKPIDLKETMIEIGEINKIVTRRLSSEYLNKADAFADGDKALGSYYAYYFLKNKLTNEPVFKSKLELFLIDTKIEISIKNNMLKLMMNNFDVHPSSGLQALLRLFVEFYIADESQVKFLIVDEIDSHLDNHICSKIIPKLNEAFPNIKIITTVHALSFFKELENNKIFIIKDLNFSYNILDSKDICGFDYINREVFNNIDIVKKKSDFQLLFTKVMNDIKLTQTELIFLNDPKNIISTNDKLIKNLILEALSDG